MIVEHLLPLVLHPLDVAAVLWLGLQAFQMADEPLSPP